MIALDLLGAGEGLASQTILVRVRKIDAAKLRAAMAPGLPCAKYGQTTPEPEPEWAAALSSAVAVADTFPAVSLAAALPVLKKQLGEYGITADVTATKAVPRAWAPGDVTVGAVLGVLLAIVGRWAYRRVARRPT